MELDEGNSDLNASDYEEQSIWLRVPRKLDFSSDSNDSYNIPPPQPDKNLSPCRASAACLESPPCRPLRILKLTEQPSTPGTIFHNCNRKSDQNGFQCRLSAPNLNPFTPESIAQNRKRCRSELKNSSLGAANAANVINNNHLVRSRMEPNETDERPAKRLNLIESNSGLSRYLTEFEEVRRLGTGNFGCVYLCTNRMDGCDYAIKKSNKPIVPGSANERRALNEVFAHAVLGKHENVVRYFSAWSENKYMLIQNEFCNGGSLQDAIEVHQQNGTHFTEAENRTILLHLSEGLRYIHSHNLAHMDIKPGNIFITRESRARPLHYHVDDSFEEDEEQIVYKFGDFGHVTSVAKTPRSVEDGDARYLAMEVFNDDYSNLTKADIFSLGLTVFETAGGGPLQKNGVEWHDLRSGKVPDLVHVSKDINYLIKLMTRPDPNMRPTALELVKLVSSLSPSTKTKEQLEREIQAVKTKSQILEKKVKAYSSLIKNEVLSRDGVRTRSNARLIGKNTSRSLSTTEFGW